MFGDIFGCYDWMEGCSWLLEPRDAADAPKGTAGPHGESSSPGREARKAPLVLLFPLLSFTQNLRSVFGSKGQALWGGRLLGRGQLWAPSIPRWYLRPGHCVWFPGGYRLTPSRPSVGLSNASHPGNTSFCAPRMHQTDASSCLQPQSADFRRSLLYEGREPAET